jgi:hypothetical protein
MSDFKPKFQVRFDDGRHILGFCYPPIGEKPADSPSQPTSGSWSFETEGRQLTRSGPGDETREIAYLQIAEKCWAIIGRAKHVKEIYTWDAYTAANHIACFLESCDVPGAKVKIVT